MPLLLEFILRTTMIAAGVAGLLRLLRVKPAAARHAAWCGVMIIMLVLPLWTGWGPRWTLHLLPQRPGHGALAAAEPAWTAAAGDLARPPSPPPGPWAWWRWDAVLAGIYLAGALALLAHLAAGTVQARLLVRRARLRDGLLTSAACQAPLTVGWLRPVVVLPETRDQWPPSQLDAVLIHEQEHVCRRDPFVQWLALLNRAVFWFHPLAWWLERKLGALAEEACDAAVLARGHAPEAYSRYLIELARSVSASGARVQVWGRALPGAALHERIRRILEGGPLPRLSRARLAAAAAACTATSLLFAGVGVGRVRLDRVSDPGVERAQGPVLAARDPVAAERRLSAAQPLPARATARAAKPLLAFAPIPGAAADVDEAREAQPLFRLGMRGLSRAAAEELRGLLHLQVGQLIDDAALERARGVVHQFDENLRLERVWFNLGTSSSGVWLNIGPPEGGAARPEHAGAGDEPESLLARVPRKLYIEVRDVSPELEAELRQRLAVREGVMLDYAAFRSELARIHEVLTAFYPQLDDRRMTGAAPRNFGSDGKWIPPESMMMKLIIAPRPARQPGVVMEQYARVMRAPSNRQWKVRVDVQGLSPEAASEVRARLPVREGEVIQFEEARRVVAQVREILKGFEPPLTAEMRFDVPPRRPGEDGTAMVPAVLVIRAGAAVR